MSMSFRQLFLSFSGRIPRSTFNWFFLSLLLVTCILFVFLETIAGAQSTWALYPFAAWGMLALIAKRLHDHGRALWNILWILIPIFGPLWLIIKLVFRKGAQGENQYGDDLLLRGADYLTVKLEA